MILYSLGRKINKRVKAIRRNQAASLLSPVRRLERFKVPREERIVAMTFDDGPMRLPSVPEIPKGTDSLTLDLLRIMDEYNAKGTFNIIGSTEENYPDKMGEVHKRSAHGVHHDHYPTYGKDSLGGAKHNPEIIRAMLSGGHELSNHGYRHVLFGRNLIVYGKREILGSIQAVESDLRRLHHLIEEEHHYTMKLSRPPHYVDRIPGGFNSYDAYTLLGYDYLAASFDGGGWMPSTGDFQEDIHKMIRPLEQALLSDEASLNGQIIFQKDGYNMSLMTPVAHALPKQLEILKKYQYRVETVSEIRSKYPFSDCGPEDEFFHAARKLDQKGYIIAYKTNELKPQQTLTHGEMVMMAMTKDGYGEELKKALGHKDRLQQFHRHPYALAYQHFGLVLKADLIRKICTGDDVKEFLYNRFGYENSIKGPITRGEYIEMIQSILEG